MLGGLHIGYKHAIRWQIIITLQSNTSLSHGGVFWLYYTKSIHAMLYFLVSSSL